MEHGTMLTVEDVAGRLAVSTRSVYAWLKSGKLRGRRAGWLWRIEGSALAEFLDSRRDGQPSG